MKKILITGGTGYLGRNLALFYKKKYKVFIGARNNKQNFLVNLKGIIQNGPFFYSTFMKSNLRLE